VAPPPVGGRAQPQHHARRQHRPRRQPPRSDQDRRRP
jgi:hypothetical protein